MKPLYEISNHYHDILNKFDSSDEITIEMENELSLVKGEFNEKIINIGSFVRNLELECESIESAIIKMEERYKKAANKISRLKDYMKKEMEFNNLNCIKSPMFDIKVKLNRPSVSIIDETIIPKKYFVEKVSLNLDKNTAYNDLKLGVEIPGLSINQNNRIEIK